MRKVCIGLAALLLGFVMVSEAVALDAFYYNAQAVAGPATQTWGAAANLRCRDHNSGDYFTGYWSFPTSTVTDALSAVNAIYIWDITLYKLSNGKINDSLKFYWPGSVALSEIGPADSARVRFYVNGAAGANTAYVLTTGGSMSSVDVLGN